MEGQALFVISQLGCFGLIMWIIMKDADTLNFETPDVAYRWPAEGMRNKLLHPQIVLSAEYSDCHRRKHHG